MNKLIITLFVGLISFSSCSLDSETNTKENDKAILDGLLAEIQTLATSVACTDSTQWAFTAYGSKACGGPQGYIAYPTTIDTAAFLQKVLDHKYNEQLYNVKWGIVSTCDTPPTPTGVTCDNNVAVLVY